MSASPKVISKLELHGVAATSSPHSLIYLPSPDESILYASGSTVNIATPVKDRDDDGKVNVLYNVNTTLRTCTLPREKDCMIRAITSMALLKHVQNVNVDADVDGNRVKNILVCAYSDGSLTLWKQIKSNDMNGGDGDSWEEDVIIGITEESDAESSNDSEGKQGGVKIEECYDSITDVDGVYQIVKGKPSIQTNLVTSSSKGVRCYSYSTTSTTTILEAQNESEKIKVINSYTKIASYPTSSIKITTDLATHELILAVGTAMPRHNRIHFYSLTITNDNDDLNYNSTTAWKHQGSLLGHLGWVSCLDWLTVDEEKGGKEKYMYLASGSHDSRIRLWKFHTPTTCGNKEEEGEVAMAAATEVIQEDGILEDVEDEDDKADDLVEEGEARMYICFKEQSNGTMMQSAVTLEALLIGHEEQVTALSWRPKSKSPCLMSSSLDRSILIWEEENDYTNSDMAAIEGVGNVWAPVTRVGTAGGILGGSVGSSLLGFINVKWNDNADQIIGHGYGGSIYFWSSNTGGNKVDSDMERWRANPCITGHFQGCSDISWEVSEGLYLLSAGLDQTCRLWTNLPSSLPSKERMWREMGRPQVHGYDLNTVACIGNGHGEMKHRFVSGADEKEIRTFDAPISTIKLLHMVHGNKLQDNKEYENRVERAFIPSLGLSNRATADDAMEEDSFANSGSVLLKSGDTNSEISMISLLKDIIDILPHERDLGVVSLWPEVRKLYGHQMELVCLASNAVQCDEAGRKVYLASSCKARDAANATIRIWDVERNMCLDILKDGHKSTVTSLSFSSDSKFLASSGKDRRLCLWRKRDVSEGAKFDLALMVESAHKRIVWSLDFCPNDPSLLCTGSRDGFLKLWRVSESTEENSQASIKELYRWEPSTKRSKKVEPITAIAFAPKPLQSSAILAIGLESGLIEIWSIPLNSDDSNRTHRLIHMIHTRDCHTGSMNANLWDCTLASCGVDHGVRNFRIKQEC